MRLGLLVYIPLFFVAEIGGSWWIWGRAPSDSIRVWYPSFWAFEAGRLSVWVPLLACAFMVVWIVTRSLRWRSQITGLSSAGTLLALSVAGLFGVSCELLTSILYWWSPESSKLRSLFHSVWYFQRVPQGSDLGWRSFPGYMCWHLVPWAAAWLIVTAVFRVIWVRRAPA
jgi:hypothetical protein